MTKRIAAAQRGAALLVAMLTVTFVALFAATAYWQQWRDVEIESAERARVQSGWILVGARDWGRAILREDARVSGADHLAEPWSRPMPETPLSTFLGPDKGKNQDMPDAFLSLHITDLQSRLNVLNLVGGGQTSASALRSFTKLFALLNLDPQQLTLLVRQLARASSPASFNNASGSDGDSSSPLMPQRMEQLAWLGISPQTIAVLRPYATLLPVHTPININTASAIVICASLESLELADAQRLVAEREMSYFRSLNDVGKVLGEKSVQLNDGRHSVASRFFELHSRLRLEQRVVEEQVVLQREKLNVKVLWREQYTPSSSPFGLVAGAMPATPAR